MAVTATARITARGVREARGRRTAAPAAAVMVAPPRLEPWPAGDRRAGAPHSAPSLRAPPRSEEALLGQPHHIECLGQRPDLVDLDQDGVGRAVVDASLQPFEVRDEQVVADDLDPLV